jgi:hypothetical protein
MQGYDQLLDSYQNLVCSPDGNESIESISPGEQHDSEEHIDEDKGDLSSDRAEGDAGRRSPSGHGSGDRNENVSGRAASGESYEDEAFFRPKREEAASYTSFDGGNLGPGGRLLDKAGGSKRR